MVNIKEEQYIEVCGQRVRIEVRRHHRAKRTSLRVAHTGQSLVLTLPMRGSLQKALAFVQQKSGWVQQRLAEMPKILTFNDVVSVSVLGVAHTLQRKQGRGITRIVDTRIEVYGSEAFSGRRLKDMLKKHMLEVCQRYVSHYTKVLNVSAKAVRVGEMKSRWGSCSASGRLAFNWRLVFAPEYVVAYLVAHEVAHLKEMNHSPRFWQQVALLCPSYMQARGWLKKNGQGLYRFG